MTTITVDRAVLKQALEALEQFVEKELTVGQRYTGEGQALLDSIESLRAALSQQEQEPLSAEVERLRYLILEIAGAMRTKAANNPYIKATTLDALADELLAGISAALAQQEQATGKESLQVEFRGGGQIATPLQLTTDDLAWLETRRLVRVWTELGQIRWTGADQGWDRAIEAVRARLDKECQDVLAWKEKVEASGQTAAQLLQKLRRMKDD